MNDSYIGKKVQVVCPKCGKELKGKESKYTASSGKEITHVKYPHHKCEDPGK